MGKYVRIGQNKNQQKPVQIVMEKILLLLKFIHPTSIVSGRIPEYVVTILAAIMTGKVFDSYLCHKATRSEGNEWRSFLITQPAF